MNDHGLKCGTFSMAVLFGLLSFTPQPAWSANKRLALIEDELLLQLKTGSPSTEVESVLKGHGAVTVEEMAPIHVKRVKVPPQALENVKAALARSPHVNFVEPNFLAQSGFTPNDANYPSQWHWSNIAAPQGWDLSKGANDVVIAVVDSGIDPTHPDLAGKLVPGWNFLGSNTDTHDVLGHGTAVAGAAAAISNNTTGVAGLAWDNPIMPLVVLDASDYASYSNIANAIIYAADHGAWVVNVSIGGSSSSSTLQNAVDYAWNKGVLVVASAMNNANSVPYYPAACSKVLAITATTSSNTLASFSSYGTWVDLAAPGANILTTNNGGGYGAWNGTSFSSPIVAGLAAMVLSVNPNLTNDEVVALLQQNTDDLGTTGFDQYFGWGKVNAYKTIAAAQSYVSTADATAPSVALVSPAQGELVSGLLPINVAASDNVGVSRVDLYLDGKLQGSDASSPFTFSVDTTKFANGTHTLLAKALDAAGNVGQSAQVVVTVDNMVDTTTPAVSITAPANGATVSGKVTIKAGATDNVGVVRTELYIDGALKASSVNGSISFNWNTTKEKTGAHILTANAYDAAGNKDSESITVYK